MNDEKKDNSELSGMGLEEDSPTWFDKKESDNPFDNNPFKNQSETKSPNSETQYHIDNERIQANRAQSKSLAKVLLALLISIGLLIAAIWGLTSKKEANNSSIQTFNQSESQINANDPTVEPGATQTREDFCSLSMANDYKRKYLPILQSERKQIENEIAFLKAKTNKTPAEQIRLKALETRLAKLNANIMQIEKINKTSQNVCKLDEAQRYITQSINDLDRVTNKIEERVINAKELGAKEEANFLKDKLEDLSRAEADIRSFSEPYLQKDLTISFKELNTPCKLKDASKYLSAWLDEIKDHINSFQSDLDQLENVPEIASVPAENTKTNLIKEKPKANSQVPQVDNFNEPVKLNKAEVAKNKADQKNIINKSKIVQEGQKPNWLASKLPMLSSRKQPKQQYQALKQPTQTQKLYPQTNTLPPQAQNPQIQTQQSKFISLPSQPAVMEQIPLQKAQVIPLKPQKIAPIEKCYEDYYEEEEEYASCNEGEVYYEDYHYHPSFRFRRSY